jgi:hypothetical protein
MGHGLRFLCALCLGACAVMAKWAALVLSLLFVIACVAGVSHVVYGTISAGDCFVGLFGFAILVVLFHLVAFSLGRAARALRASADATAEQRGFEVKLAAPRPVLPAEETQI